MKFKTAAVVLAIFALASISPDAQAKMPNGWAKSKIKWTLSNSTNGLAVVTFKWHEPDDDGPIEVEKAYTVKGMKSKKGNRTVKYPLDNVHYSFGVALEHFEGTSHFLGHAYSVNPPGVNHGISINPETQQIDIAVYYDYLFDPPELTLKMTVNPQK